QDQAQAIDDQVPLAALDLLAAVVARLPAGATALDRLAVEVGGARRALAAGLLARLVAQGVVDPLPGAVLAPLAEVVVGGGPGAVVLGQGAPLAAGAVDVEDGVHDVVEVDLAGPPARLGRREQGLKEGKLLVGQVA